MARPRRDIIGMQIGYWTVLEPGEDKASANGLKRVVVCKCRCGTIRSVLETNLISRKSLSCGCMQKAQAKERMQKLWSKKKAVNE